MSWKTRGPGIPDWLMVVCLTVAIGAAAGAGHVVDGPASQPTTASSSCKPYLQAGSRSPAHLGETVRNPVLGRFAIYNNRICAHLGEYCRN